jgi:hypothetical protein
MLTMFWLSCEMMILFCHLSILTCAIYIVSCLKTMLTCSNDMLTCQIIIMTCADNILTCQSIMNACWKTQMNIIIIKYWYCFLNSRLNCQYRSHVIYQSFSITAPENSGDFDFGSCRSRVKSQPFENNLVVTSPLNTPANSTVVIPGYFCVESKALQ